MNQKHSQTVGLSPGRIAELQAEREALVAQLAELQQSDKVKRFGGQPGTSGGHPSSWRQAVQSTERLIASIDKLLKPHERPKKAPRPTRPPDPARYEVIARWPNTPRTEVRLSIKTRGQTKLLDLRVWRLDAETDDVFTLRGCAIDASQFDSLLAAMTVMRNRLAAGA